MDLFRDIKKGRFGHNPELKRAAKHELSELGGPKIAEAHEKKIEMAKKMDSKTYSNTKCAKCGKFGHHHSEHSEAEEHIKAGRAYGRGDLNEEREHMIKAGREYGRR